MSNVVINIFGMTAVLSRATRTMAKEDLNGDYEVSEIFTLGNSQLQLHRTLVLFSLSQYIIQLFKNKIANHSNQSQVPIFLRTSTDCGIPAFTCKYEFSFISI